MLESFDVYRMIPDVPSLATRTFPDIVSFYSHVLSPLLLFICVATVQAQKKKEFLFLFKRRSRKPSLK
jgi:hypothetical protein